MVLRKLLLVSLLAVVSGRLTNTDTACVRLCQLKQHECPSPCAPCPNASCPVPVCPPQPPSRCPPLPEIPTCPTPVINLTCPTCPACPPAPKCATPDQSIPRGYRTIPGLGSYKFFYEKRTWTDAHIICSSDGGHLAIPNTKVKRWTQYRILSGKMDQLISPESVCT
ncbi:Hemolymph lipopolysaccharide-binding protein [Gryllus bimaculatus]|nr:Hemolymph lipopolysaccharide-binding protein [Gryllus bimaculatus]